MISVSELRITRNLQHDFPIKVALAYSEGNNSSNLVSRHMLVLKPEGLEVGSR
jgi:hypothetical protein